MNDIDALVETLKKYNAAYRNGRPLVSDHEYDRLIKELGKLDPKHIFLRSVEAEIFGGRKKVRHPVPMLSTEKAYTKDAFDKFITRVVKEAGEIGIKNILFKITPKLDGLAGRDNGKIFVTRGNGETGYEISSVFQKGVIPIGGRGLGLGEIVMVKSYFDEHLSDKFEHPRNMVVGIVTSDTLNEYAQKALQDNMVHFVPYSMLPEWKGKADELIKNLEKILKKFDKNTNYPMDGMVAEVTDEDVKQYMGATSHHFRWQIAIKTKGATAITTVEGIKWQVGRTGNVTPVLEVRPVSLSGATIRRVTAHHAGFIQKKLIGTGAEIEIIRSGEVIPKLEKVIQESNKLNLPEKCPSCGSVLDWDNDFLKCNNNSCKAKIVQSISHWFKTLGTADWFGTKTIAKLVKNGYDSLIKIYGMHEDDFTSIGFGPIQSRNLANAINISKTKQVEDWRFLAAFGISDLGTGDSRKLLSNLKIEKLIHMKTEDIKKIHGFGAITSKSIVNGIEKIKDIITYMLSLNFNLQKTPLASELKKSDSKIAGKQIIFTGKMQHKTREAMEIEARKLGAKIQSSVNRKTDYLICGEKVGPKKIEKAKKNDVMIISETEYFDMIKGKQIG